MSWMNQAACRGNTERMFCPEGLKGHHATEWNRQAKEVCAGCPVLRECREYILSQPDPAGVYGVWGGLSQRDRRDLRLRRTA